MSVLYQPILTSVGYIKSDDEMKERFMGEVLSLLETGNLDGLGGSYLQKLINSIVPFPPQGGPMTLDDENFFHFKPEINIDLFKEILPDEKKSGNWQKVFVSNLYLKTIKAFDVKGATPLAAPPLFVFDAPTINPIIPIPYSLAEISTAFAALPDPTPPALLVANLSAAGIIPTQLIPPQKIEINLLELNPIPGMKNDLLDLVEKIVNFPGLLLGELISEYVDPIKLFQLAINPLEIIPLAVEKTGSMLKSIFSNFLEENFIPKILVASVLILLKEIICMVVLVVIGGLLGSGNIVKNVAKLIGMS
jgi:hypothetical protein